MKTLVFDAETTGLVDFKLAADHPSQPHICELAAMWTSGPGNHETALDTLIKPVGWKMPDAATEVHGITTEMCEEDGVPLGDALVALLRLFDEAERIVGFGVAFDLKIVRGGCRRLGMDDCYAAINPKKFDLMHKCKPLCKLPPTAKMLASNFKGFKTPTLGEASEILLKRPLADAHQALVDVEATADLYWLIEGGGQEYAGATVRTGEAGEKPASDTDPDAGGSSPPPRSDDPGTEDLVASGGLVEAQEAAEASPPPLADPAPADDNEFDPI